MAKPASGELRYHNGVPWTLRKVILVVAGVSLALWAALLVAVL